MKSLETVGKILRETFATDLAKDAKVIASNARENSDAFSANHLTDGDRRTYWATDDSARTPDVVLDLGKPATFNIVRLREFLPLGQRVEGFALDQWKDGKWEQFARSASIGSCRLVKVPSMTTDKVRLRITKSPVCPAIAEFGLFADSDGAK